MKENILTFFQKGFYHKIRDDLGCFVTDIIWRFSKFFLFLKLITGRNEVVAKVMFLQVCVCPRGGGCLPQCMLGCHAPPPPDGGTPRMENPPRTRQTPPQMEEPPPGTRQTPPDGEPPTPPDQADPPPDGEPPGTRQTPPPGKQTPAYGLRAAGTHPTGMHSCSKIVLERTYVPFSRGIFNS